MVKSLFDIDYIHHYGVTTPHVSADEYHVAQQYFDLDDTVTPPVVAAKQGQVSFANVPGGVDVLAYERFVNQCKKPKAFVEGLKRCDYLITSHSSNAVVCLLEMTSAYGSIRTLSLPIFRKKDGNLEYVGGKYEKVEEQLSTSLKTMLAVPSIANNFQSRVRKVCLMSYVVYPYSNLLDRIKHPLLRYLGVEARETLDNGTWIDCPSIQSQGFEYRRISHESMFIL